MILRPLWIKQQVHDHCQRIGIARDLGGQGVAGCKQAGVIVLMEMMAGSLSAKEGQATARGGDL